MMRRKSEALVVVGLALVACGGHFDVGSMEPHGASGSTGSGTSGSASAGASNVGAAPSSTGGSMAVGGSAAVVNMPPTDELGPRCVPSGQPPPLTGPFAEPAVVWNRISMLTWGMPMGPLPFALPAATTYEWAGNMVTFALLDVKNTTNGSRGLESVLRQWANLTPQAPLRGPWADELLNDVPALHVLLLTPFLDADRLGIFTEPSWLTEHSSISARGANVYSALLMPVPTPPEGVQKALMPEPNRSERQTLAVATQEAVCSGCHELLDPPGFALGHFDAQGAYRALDGGQPIDTTGSVLLPGSGLRVQFEGLRDFNAQLADSCAANTGFADAFLRLAVTLNGVADQEQVDFMSANSQRVRQAFLNGGRTYEAAVKAYIQSPAGLYP